MSDQRDVLFLLYVWSRDIPAGISRWTSNWRCRKNCPISVRANSADRLRRPASEPTRRNGYPTRAIKERHIGDTSCYGGGRRWSGTKRTLHRSPHATVCGSSSGTTYQANQQHAHRGPSPAKNREKLRTAKGERDGLPSSGPYIR